jgi:hypothetical protein
MGSSAFIAANTAPSVWGGPIRVNAANTNPVNSDVSTADTIGIMRKLAHQYATDPYVQNATAQATGRLRPGASDRDIASAIFHWIRVNIRFVEDEQLMYEQLGVAPEYLDKELLIVPPTLLAMPQPMGDCDDFSLLTACQLLCAGLRSYWVTVATDRSNPSKFSHIYSCVRLEDEAGYLCLDAGNRLTAVPPGWEPSNVTRKAIWTV